MRCLLVTLCAVACAALAVAQTSVAAGGASTVTPRGAQLEVASVSFAFATPPESTARWLEISIDVRVQPTSGNFVDRPRATLSFATKSSTAERALTHYRASITAVTLERGAARFRFYLPPEIVRRDALGTDFEFWRVELHAGEQVQPFAPAGVSVALRDAARLREFLQRVDTEAGANDGVLQPQHLTSFADAYPGATPTVLRKEAR